MMYFTPSTAKRHTYPDYFGSIIAPRKNDHGNSLARIRSGWRWILDNGMYSGSFQEDLFFRYLANLIDYRSRCVFAVVPDVLHRRPDGSVIGDAQATLDLFPRYADRIRALGYPVAYVAQDGQEDLPFPAGIDALFIGGSTAWKLGAGAVACIKRAQDLGLWVHVGRVNTLKRIRYFSMLRVDSVDGTTIIYRPDHYRKALIRWMDQARHPLFHF